MRRGGLSAQREMERVDNMNEPWSHLGFGPADVLLPREEAADLTRWSVVACDQYTSQPQYWREVEKFVGTKPSTLNMMVPEIDFTSIDLEQHIADLIRLRRIQIGKLSAHHQLDDLASVDIAGYIGLMRHHDFADDESAFRGCFFQDLEPAFLNK